MFVCCCSTVLAASNNNKGGMVFILFWLLFVCLPIFLSKRSKANSKKLEKNDMVPNQKNIHSKRYMLRHAHGASHLLKTAKKQNIFPIQLDTPEDFKPYTLSDQLKDEFPSQIKGIPVEKNENKISNTENTFSLKNKRVEDAQKNQVVKDILTGMKSRKQIMSYMVASAILGKPKALTSEDGWKIE